MTTPNPMPVIPLEYEHPPEGAAARTSRALRIFTFGTWGACLIAWILIVCVDVESVIVTGPIIAILGGAVACAACSSGGTRWRFWARCTWVSACSSSCW